MFRHKTRKLYFTYTVPVILIIQIAAVILLQSSCSSGSAGYKQISQDEAMQMMQEQTDYLIVDVRRPDEFAEGHIPGAINVPVEAINTAEDAAELSGDLPDQDQILLIYCRTGRRSKEASKKLAEMGYTGIYEFGGIATWEGEVETE
jgi:rhodanese-related sulfurtransferase